MNQALLTPRIFGPALIAVAAVHATALPALAQIPCRYVVEVLPQVGFSCFGEPSALVPTGMSESGIVTGFYNQCATTHQNSFVWFGSGPIVTLQSPPGVVDANALAVNDAGQVVGQHSNTTTDLGFTGFLWHIGTWTDLGAPSWATNSEALAINRHGMIAGYVANLITGPLHACIWQDGKLLDIHSFFGFTDSKAEDLSGNGYVTGWVGIGMQANSERAFIWNGNEALVLDAIPGGITSRGRSTNSLGHVAGHGRVLVKGGPTTLHAFFWDGRQMRGIEGIPNLTRSLAVDMNDSDVVVGEFELPIGGGAFVWHDGVMRDLQELIDTPGIVIHYPAAINNAGVILCKGHLNGSSRAFKLIPQFATADLTFDCQVNGMDLNLLLTEWAKTNSSADLNKDNTVNGIDLGILLSQWTLR